MRREHAVIGCMVAPALLLAILIYVMAMRTSDEGAPLGDTGSGLEAWKECPIPLPNDGGRVVFLWRQPGGPLDVYERQVRFAGPRADTDAAGQWLPKTASAPTPMNVFWIDAAGGRGPWLRLQDAGGEFLFNLRARTTAVLRRENDQTLAGQILSPTDALTTKVSDDGKLTGRIGDRPAVDITGTPPAQAGELLGRLECDRGMWRFSPAAESTP